MKQALNKLKSEVCSFQNPRQVSDEQWNDFIKTCTVALMAGGESSRFREVPGSEKANKNAHKLPNNDTMIEMTIRMYRDAGITNFVALVYHNADSIIELLGDGSKYGVKITYSHDPEIPVGKGGAVLNALLNKSIDRNHHLIVHNPDDVIVDYEGNFPKDIVSGHLHGIEEGYDATLVVVEETPYAYTGMEIQNGKVSNIEMYPMIPIPTHIGVTIFSPNCYNLFEELFSIKEKSDFEQILFPILANKGKLYSHSIPSNKWIAVNNLKAYKQLVKRLAT